MDELARIRGEIDQVDRELISLLKTRFEMARSLGRIKRAENLPIRDRQREHVILVNAERNAKLYGLPIESTRRIFLQSFDLALRAQAPESIRDDLEGQEALI